jgi:hypothetical protein
MSDSENGHKPSRIIPIRDRQDPAGKRMSSREIKEEIIAGVAAGSLAMGQKVYTQCMEQTTKLLEEMEHRLQQDYDAKIEALREESRPRSIVENDLVVDPFGGVEIR